MTTTTTTTAANTAGKSWADDVDETSAPNKNTVREDSDYTSPSTGIRTTIQFLPSPTPSNPTRTVKVTTKSRMVPQKKAVNHQVAMRLALPKFGLEKGNAPGPDRATTTIGEAVALKLSIGGKGQGADAAAAGGEEEKSVQEKLKTSSGGGKVACRLCKGDHFTAKCPYKDTLGGGDESLPPLGDGPIGISLSHLYNGSFITNQWTGEEPALAIPGGPTGSKYVPPSIRNKSAGEKMGAPGGSRDDLPTLRITNISEDTQEQDLRDLFNPFGRVARVYVGRDRETGAGKVCGILWC